MEKFYDKILFGLAITILCIGVLMYVTGLKSNDKTIEKIANIDPYTPYPTDALNLDAFSWPPAEQQDAGPEWVYQVFTPPQIWLETTTGKFVPKPVELPPLEPFRLELTFIGKPLYRYQFKSYLEANGEVILNIQDLKEGKSLRITENSDLPEAKVSTFNIVREKVSSNPDVFDRIPTLLVFDQAANVIRSLIAGKETTLNYVEVTFTHQSGKSVSLRDEGSEFTIGKDQYVLKQFDVTTKTAKVERTYTDVEGNIRTNEQVLSL